jgi:lysozyme
MLHLYHLLLKRILSPFIICVSGKAAIKATLTGAAAGIALLLVTQLEGVSLRAYLDTAGVPTICYGHTASAHIGQTRTTAQCDELLQGDLGVALDAVRQNLDVPVPASMEAALASFVFNVGVDAFEHSTLLRLVNEGRLPEACIQMKRWVCEATPSGYGNIAGPCVTAKRNKRLSKGLTNRREKEVAVCLHDI